MTPKRKKWWNSLPVTQKYLRREISNLKYKRSEEKLHASTTWSITIRRAALKRINYYTAYIRALKHELDRTTTMVYTGSFEGISPIYRCEKCGGVVVDNWQWCCPWCGREIKEWIESQKPGEVYSWLGNEMPLAKKGVKK